MYVNERSNFLYMTFGINILVDVIKIIGVAQFFEVNERYKLKRRFDKHYHVWIM
jgi:hypothetical protein